MVKESNPNAPEFTVGILNVSKISETDFYDLSGETETTELPELIKV